MDVIIVCHTEYGRVKDHDVIYDKKARQGVQAGVPDLVKIADMHGAKVTFGVMPEVASDFPKGTGHEIGLHVHPGWEEFSVKGEKYSVGDAYLREHCKTSSDSSVLKDHSYEDQLDMIRAGKDILADTFGSSPEVFVAGRWSINNDTVRALVETGFTHDCSAPAHKKPSHYDWSKLPRICMPYHPDRSDYQKKGDLPLLIVPIAQTLMGASVNPEIIPFIGLQWLKACFLEYYRQNMPLFHICLHSPCMLDPYYRESMDSLIKFISGFNVSFKFASQVPCYGNVAPKTDIVPYLFGLNGNMIKTGLKSLKIH